MKHCLRALSLLVLVGCQTPAQKATQDSLAAVARMDSARVQICRDSALTPNVRAVFCGNIPYAGH